MVGPYKAFAGAAVRRGPTPLDQPLANYRAGAARARAAGNATVTAWLGDSFTESFSPTKRGLRWMNRLAHRLNARREATVQYVPAATSTGSTTAAGTWPGGQAPWTYTGSVAGSVVYGADLHAVTMATSATATIVYFGDSINIYFTRTPGGPAAAAVTLDGAAQTAINAQGSELPGSVATFGTVGDYGVHTLVITATAAPLVLEGALIHDGTRFGFGVPFDAIYTLCYGHAGFSTQQYVDNTNWVKSFANQAATASLIGISFGPNDALANRSGNAFRDNLLTIVDMIDDQIRALGSTPAAGILFYMMPTAPTSYLDAAATAAATLGQNRAAVIDLAALLPDAGNGWGIFDAGNGHPNDAGQLWIADRLVEIIDPAAATGLPRMDAGGPIIEAADVPTARSNWAASLGFTNGQAYDTTVADNAVRERRHRKWFEPGVYTPRVRYEQITTTGGTVQVLIGNTSAGTVATTGTTGTIGETALASPVTIDSPGWYPVTIRHTAATNAALRFMRCKCVAA